jgi:hypothetical protein
VTGRAPETPPPPRPGRAHRGRGGDWSTRRGPSTRSVGPNLRPEDLRSGLPLSLIPAIERAAP